MGKWLVSLIIVCFLLNSNPINAKEIKDWGWSWSHHTINVPVVVEVQKPEASVPPVVTPQENVTTCDMGVVKERMCRKVARSAVRVGVSALRVGKGVLKVIRHPLGVRKGKCGCG